MDSNELNVTISVKNTVNNFYDSLGGTLKIREMLEAKRPEGMSDETLYLGFLVKISTVVEALALELASTQHTRDMSIDVKAAAFILMALVREYISTHLPDALEAYDQTQTDYQRQLDYANRFAPNMEEN